MCPQIARLHGQLSVESHNRKAVLVANDVGLLLADVNEDHRPAAIGERSTPHVRTINASLYRISITENETTSEIEFRESENLNAKVLTAFGARSAPTMRMPCRPIGSWFTAMTSEFK